MIERTPEDHAQFRADMKRLAPCETCEELRLTIQMLDDNRRVQRNEKGVKAWDGRMVEERVRQALRDRGDKRSVTPAGFARAVFEANRLKVVGSAPVESAEPADASGSDKIAERE